MHDECNGSDVFGSDICTCRPYLIHGIEECARAGQSGGLGIIIYNRKEGRALGEVTKFLVYNARKRQEGGDAAAQYFERTECVAGVQDARFQQLMPDVVHWLGLKRIDRFVSMSDMKHDALTSQGIEIVERVPIPDDMIPADAHVEIAAKKAAGYYTPEPQARSGQSGRPFARKILRERQCHSSDPETSAALSLLNAGAVRERAHRMLAIGLEDRLPNFRIDLDRMDGVVDLVLETTRKAYPSFDVPFHSRWRHFVTNGDNRWAAVADRTEWPDRAARARAEFDLAIVSVFLDAGAGPSWRYRDPKTGSAIGRSEGLGLASLAMFTAGAFSADPLDAVARRCRHAREFRRCRPRARHAGLGCQSAGRVGGPRRPVASPGPAGGLETGNIRQPRHAAAGRPVRPAGDAGGRWKAARARRSWRNCCSNSGRSGHRG